MTDIIQHVTPLNTSDHRIMVGRYTYGNPKFMLWSENERISIGSFCSIADEVTIFGGGEHRLDWVTTYPLRIAFGDPLAHKDGHPSNKGHTVIGNDVWIGYGATILSGVTIGDGAVIGAKALVVKDVLPYTVVGGNPALQVKKRFDDFQIAKLLEISWWDWPIEQIYTNRALLCSENIDFFLTNASL